MRFVAVAGDSVNDRSVTLAVPTVWQLIFTKGQFRSGLSITNHVQQAALALKHRSH